MQFKLVSANDKNVEIRDPMTGFGWVFWIAEAGGTPTLTTEGMNQLPNKQGEMPAAHATADAFAFATREGRRNGVVG